MSDLPLDPSNLTEYSVSEISTALKRQVEETFARVRVRGEISGFKRAASGHVYLALKDDKALLDGVMWRNTAQRLSIRPEDGLEVVCEGRLTTYAARSKYQLVIESMTIAGAGALLALVEERRKKLAAEGLFDDARKQPLPFLPEVIGVVTSPTGAVIRDILHRLRDRFPRHVLLWPVLVQGEGAPEQIAAAIRGFNDMNESGAVPRPDLLIVARGGGSVEDLMAFNEEIVVRAVADSAIPVISAVGHETDTTLIDHASDQRAPTPTAAAEIAVPVRAELVLQVKDLERRMFAGMTRQITDRRRLVESFARGLPRPQALIGDAAQRLDDKVESLRRMMGAYLDRLAAKIAQARLRSPAEQIAAKRERLIVRAERFDRALDRLLERKRDGLDGLDARLESVSYAKVLERGYAVVRDAAGAVIGTVTAAKRGAPVDIEFKDGRAPAVIGGAPATPRGAKRGGDGSQGSLL